MNLSLTTEPRPAALSSESDSELTPEQAHSLRGAVFRPIGDEGRVELVERRLVDAITRGHLRAGERLPSEADLSRSLGVASVTVREALHALRQRSLIVTRRGRNGGSFVADHADPLFFARNILRNTSRRALRDLGAHYASITCACVRFAAKPSDPSEAQKIRHRVALIDKLDDHSQRRLLDNVYIEIVALSRSPRLIREQMKLQAEVSPFLRLVAQEFNHLQRQTAQINTLIDTIEIGDREGAMAVIVQITKETVDALLRLKSQLE